jgi:hypothetical protein
MRKTKQPWLAEVDISGGLQNFKSAVVKGLLHQFNNCIYIDG